MVIGALAFALRALLAALIADPVALVLVAPLEGIGFACVFVGGVTVVAAQAPAGLQGTAQGLFAAASGLATIIGSVAGGAIAGALGIPGLFLSVRSGASSARRSSPSRCSAPEHVADPAHDRAADDRRRLVEAGFLARPRGPGR